MRQSLRSVTGAIGLRRPVMARAEIASACARPDSIKGLAQSIARPAYRRLLNAEPALRRAVPALIVAFLVTVGIGAVIQAFAHRNQAIADVVEDIELITEILADRLNHAAAEPKVDVSVAVQRAMERSLPRLASAPSRWLLVTNPSGVVVAASPSAGSYIGLRLEDVLGRTQLMTTHTGVQEVTLSDGTTVLAAVHGLTAPLGQLAVLQPMSDVLARWRSDTALTVTLFATTLFVLLILGFAFHWQARRASESDHIYDMVRSIVDTGLNRADHVVDV